MDIYSSKSSERGNLSSKKEYAKTKMDFEAVKAALADRYDASDIDGAMDDIDELKAAGLLFTADEVPVEAIEEKDKAIKEAVKDI